MSSFKRHRGQSGGSSSSSGSDAIPSKSLRTASETSSTGNHPLLCTLPPTCNQHPMPIANAKDLESHYATYHAHVCVEGGCDCVFPDARLLELHQTECHDPLAAVRKDRGEKIFACHLASCTKFFQTPKARRLHLIQGHGYPKEYFFAVTNKGVGGLLRRWGEGASLIRPVWKSRDDPGSPNNRDVLVEEDDDVCVEEQEKEEAEEPPPISAPVGKQPPSGVDSLTDSLHSLSLVPESVRFGRGGKNGGFGAERGGNRTLRGRGGARQTDGHEMDVDVVFVDGSKARGRGIGDRAPPTGDDSGNPALGYIPRALRGRAKPKGRAMPQRGLPPH